MMYPYKSLLLCLLAFTALQFPALAQEQEEEENTFSQPIQEFAFSESVYLQDQHEIQSTLTYNHNYTSEQIGNNLSFEIEYGITDWVQVSAEYGYQHQHRSEQKSYDLKQLEFGSKVSLFNTPLQQASFAIGVEFPVHKVELTDEEVEGSETSYSSMLVYARQLGNMQLHLNAGTEVEQQQYEWFYNAAAVYGKGRLHPLLELNGTYEDGESNWYLAPGIVLNSKNNWEFIAGARRSLRNSEWGVTLRLVYEFTAGPE